MATPTSPPVNKPIWKQQARKTNRLALPDALQRLREMSHEAELEPHIAAWARDSLGINDEELDQWCARAWWGRAAAYAVGRRILSGREDEVRPLIAQPDWSSLHQLLEQGRGLIVAGAHLGPRLVVHFGLRWAGFGVRALTGNAKIRAKFGNDAMDMDNHIVRGASLASAVVALRRGNIVYVMADGRQGDQLNRGDLIGHDLTISTGLLRLLRATQTPSIPIAATWQDDRIHLAVGPHLPQPDEEAGVREQSWTDAYFAWYQAVILTSPENLRLVGGFWRPGGSGFH